MTAIRTSRKSALKQALLSTSLSTSLLALVSPTIAVARDGGDGYALHDTESSEQIATNQDGTTSEAIIITGSRLRRDTNLDSPSPIVSLPVEALREEQDVTEALRTIPALSASVSTAQSVAPGELASGGAVGAATLNLRGLGAERTLVLVNGRRHVAGVAETSVVDINAIPAALIKNIEVLTGGASAIYGADAVTGVVNFILDKDYDGIELGFTASSSDRGDGGNVDGYIKLGRNFGEGRGNVTLVGEYSRDEGLRFGDRAQFRDGNISDDGPNPALRFQRGDLGTSATPNFNAFYDLANGRYPYGFVIPTPGTPGFNRIFTGGVTPTAAEQALIDRAANAPTRAIGPRYMFQITSAGGVIVPADFADPFSDIDGNGRSDCTESFTGFNSLFDYAGAFGAAGGCYVATPDGLKVITNDGQIASNFNSFGGDYAIFDNDGYLIPKTERYGINILADYDIFDGINASLEGKYYRQETTFGSSLNSYYDLLTVAPDNPFIPAVLQPIADAAGGLFVTRDPNDLGANIDTNISETWRFVAGLSGEITEGIRFEASANWGRYDLKSINRNNVLFDRFLAAIDATRDARGNPVCRSELNPATRSPGTVFGIPSGEFGYLTFVPGQGQCKPANILGYQSISQEAVDFITTTTINTFRTDQLELHAAIAGESNLLGLPYDSIQFAIGAEYRDERSRSRFDPLVRGILPVTTVDGNAGDFVGDLGFSQTSLATPPDERAQNSGGSYDVYEVFGELGTTLIRDVPFIEELRLELAGRYSNYSTVGAVYTYAINGFWAPVEDVRLRGTYSRAVRAPNISELFAPPQAAFFRPFDPCDQTEIDRLSMANFANIQNRVNNCRADGIPQGFSDPLSARFAGTISGNPNLQEETADTYTVGVVVQPRWIPGLAVTVDYYNITIDDAISTLNAQDVVDNCYDSTTFPNEFCSLFTRNRDSNSAQFLGFNSLNLRTINFVGIETAGVDATVSYRTSIGQHRLEVTAAASWTDKIDFFFDPTDLTRVDPELGELQRPEWAGRGTVSYGIEDFGLDYTLIYFGPMALRSVEIETIETQFGPAGRAGETFVHNIGVSYRLPENGFELFGGVNNLTDVKPFVTERAYPVSPIGRTLYFGVRLSL